MSALRGLHISNAFPAGQFSFTHIQICLMIHRCGHILWKYNILDTEPDTSDTTKHWNCMSTTHHPGLLPTICQSPATLCDTATIHHSTFNIGEMNVRMQLFDFVRDVECCWMILQMVVIGHYHTMDCFSTCSI